MTRQIGESNSYCLGDGARSGLAALLVSNEPYFFGAPEKNEEGEQPKNRFRNERVRAAAQLQ
jgi:hypothetical protein